jgi:hypothetical protein
MNGTDPGAKEYCHCRIFWFSLIVVLVTEISTTQAAVKFSFTEKGKPKSEIVLPETSSEVTRYAASRLQSVVAEISGINLPIVSESKASSSASQILLGTLTENRQTSELLKEKRLVVSFAERAQESLKQVLVPENLSVEGFVIYAGDYQGRPNLVLTGRTPLSGLYAVETLADRIYVEAGELVAGPLVSEVTPVVNEPAFRVRSIATNISGPDWVAGGQWEQEWTKRDGSYDWHGFIDWMASHKMNNLDAWIFNLAFGIAYDSKRFPELVNHHQPNVKHEFMKSLIDYAHQRGISVFSMIDFPDNWTSVVKAHPELAGKNFNPKEIPDGQQWENYQKYGEARLNQEGGERLRSKYSWVCMSEPKTLQFWRDYINDLLEQYPGLDGIGLQVAEGAQNRCNCEKCTKDPLGTLEKYFAAMVDVGRSKNPNLKFWIYNSWGTRDIEAHQSHYPNFISVDWSMMLGPLYYQQYLPRGTWYLVHTMGQRFSEFTYKYAAIPLNERGQEGMQIRAAAYKTQDNAFQAFEEFSWNPRLGMDQFAELYVKKLYHKTEQQIAELYAAWMNLLGYRSLTGATGRGFGAAGVFYENPNRDSDQAKADEAKATVTRLLGQIQDQSELVTTIRSEFGRLDSAGRAGGGRGQTPSQRGPGQSELPDDKSGGNRQTP